MAGRGTLQQLEAERAVVREPEDCDQADDFARQRRNRQVDGALHRTHAFIVLSNENESENNAQIKHTDTCNENENDAQIKHTRQPGHK